MAKASKLADLKGRSNVPESPMNVANQGEDSLHYSDDPRDIGWVRENIPCQTACPADTNVPEYIRLILEGVLQ